MVESGPPMVQRFGVFAAVMLTTAAAMCTAGDTGYDLYFLIGQSNMAGQWKADEEHAGAAAAYSTSYIRTSSFLNSSLKLSPSGWMVRFSAGTVADLSF